MMAGMGAENLALVRGMDDTRAALRRWSADPWPTLGGWAAKAFAIACGLLVAVYAVARTSIPDFTPVVVPGVTRPATVSDLGFVLLRNATVLALHAFACVAGFIAGSSIPLEAAQRRGAWKAIHDWAGTLAIWFVVLATGFSLVTQALALGEGTVNVAAQLGIPPGLLLSILSIHALPELTALFLPLAAWLMASRRGEWRDLLAATFVTVAVAVPTLIVTAVVETYLTPLIIRAAIGA
jgi:hypothetical protein